MKKALIIVVTILVMVAMATAQDGTRAPQNVSPANTNFLNVDGSNGHIKHGCMLCHAPHSANALTVTGNLSVYGAVNAGNFDTGVVPTAWPGIAATNAGGAVRGDIYLWGTALSAQTYTTWDGTTKVSQAGITNGKGSAVVHTLLCMSCHDNANSGYLMGMGFEKPPGTENGGTNQNAVTDGWGDHIGLSTIAGATNTWNATSSLQNSHPVHAAYTASSYNWKFNTDGTFKDKTFALTATQNGHPAKLWMDGGVAYVECTSCHDPHRETAFAYWNGTNYTIGAANSTIFYLRGPYSDPTSGNGNTNANFCRSCHFSKSQAYADWKGLEP